MCLLWASVLLTLTYPDRKALRVVAVRLWSQPKSNLPFVRDRLMTETTQYQGCTENVFHLGSRMYTIIPKLLKHLRHTHIVHSAHIN